MIISSGNISFRKFLVEVQTSMYFFPSFSSFWNGFKWHRGSWHTLITYLVWEDILIRSGIVYICGKTEYIQQFYSKDKWVILSFQSNYSKRNFISNAKSFIFLCAGTQNMLESLDCMYREILFLLTWLSNMPTPSIKLSWQYFSKQIRFALGHSLNDFNTVELSHYHRSW